MTKILPLIAYICRS